MPVFRGSRAGHATQVSERSSFREARVPPPSVAWAMVRGYKNRCISLPEPTDTSLMFETYFEANADRLIVNLQTRKLE